jgi:hypothetical protein
MKAILARFIAPAKSTINLVIIAVIAMGLSTASAEEFEALFNGKDLSGWDGKDGFWRVENGTIVGETTEDNPTDANTFLIWQDGEVEDFEFSCQVKFTGNNSGVQYRSEAVGDVSDFALRGYQADLHPKQDYFGTFLSGVRREWHGFKRLLDSVRGAGFQ